jgi:hypothetical protein
MLRLVKGRLTFLGAILFAPIVISGCLSKPSLETARKADIIKLEYKWFEAEFSADTAFLSVLLDSTFMCVTEDGVLTKQQILHKMGINKKYRMENDIVIDSVRLENVIFNDYEDFAVVTFVDHTYGKKRDTPLEFKTQFYDVWIRRNNEWKAVSSQAHY